MHLVDGEVKKKNNIVLMKVSADKKNLIGHIPTQRKAPTLKIGNWKDDYRYYLCKKYFEEGIKEGVHYNFSKYEGSNIDLLNYIYDKMIDKVDDVDKDSLDAYIDKYIVRRMINTYQRIRRAYRKVDFHSSVGAYFNYFITITYDDALFNSPEEFSRKFYR